MLKGPNPITGVGTAAAPEEGVPGLGWEAGTIYIPTQSRRRMPGQEADTRAAAA